MCKIRQSISFNNYVFAIIKKGRRTIKRERVRKILRMVTEVILATHPLGAILSLGWRMK